MIWKINRLGSDRTTVFAANELASYLRKMNPSIEVCIVAEPVQSDAACISVGCHVLFDSLLRLVKDKRQDDAIYINVQNAAGVITGTNPRSVLIAVYRYLKELGCEFIRPGKDNEIIPACNPADHSVLVSEAASYRHREVCIEGAVSYEHVSDMIDWIPKVAMNGYYTQFVKPYGFFRVWYSHEANPYWTDESKSDEELAEIMAKLEDEIEERGLLYSAVGHSWSCECLGVDGSYWKKEPPPSDEIRKYLAMCNGQRDWYGEVPVNTNLCYSNPEVQELMTDYMVKYAQDHPAVANLVFWLADDEGNYCQCDECKKGTFVDFYVQMINLLDEKLTALNMDTKIVFLLTHNIPSFERIKNKDRVVMMLAPIFRDFSEPYPDVVGDEYNIDLPVFTESDCAIFADFFKPMKNNIALLKKWQNVFGGDTEVYDYLLIWFHFMDPGYMFCAETIAKDIKNLEASGINGISSCQGQRVFFPTGLPMVTMAETLWNKNASYEHIRDRYLTAAFGKDGKKVGTLLEAIGKPEITRIMTSAEALNWKKTKGDDMIALIQKSYGPIEDLEKLIIQNLSNTEHPAAVLQSWKYLQFYPEYARLYMEVWIASYGEADIEKTRQVAVKLVEYVNKNEKHLHRVLDGCLFRRRIYYFFNTHRLPGVVLDV